MAESNVGPAGSSPSTSNWNVETGAETNDSLDALGNNPQNLSLSGDSQLYITPLCDRAHNTWTSAKIYSNNSWRCDDNNKMIFQGQLRLGNNPNQQGIWPAFWALGESLRQGGSQHKDWPQCGEWDILESVNGDGVGHGTLHCKDATGQDPGNAWPNSTSRTVNFQPGAYHTWRFQVDLSGEYNNQSLTWSLDGNSYYTIHPSDLNGGQDLWNEVARSAFYLILNIAIGGNWPMDPVPAPPGAKHIKPGTNATTAATQDGFNSGMQVKYVAVYKSQPGYKGEL